MDNKDFILILGPQGSGKTTQGKLLADYLHYRFISTGELLRQAYKENNPLGAKLSEYWATGDLVPNEIIEGILFPILEMDQIPGFVVDGYPRTIEQVESLVSFLDLNSWKINHVFYMHVGDQECINRILERTKTEQRPDESPEAIHHRLQIYHKETEPLLNTYEKMGCLHRINAEKTIDEIQADVRAYFPAETSTT